MQDAPTISALRAEIETLRHEISRLAGDINILRVSLEPYLHESPRSHFVEVEITSIRSAINFIQSQIASKESQIALKESQITSIESQIMQKGDWEVSEFFFTTASLDFCM
jgi:capsule polysaccharide export protein KpsE/RkpR